MCYLNYGTGPDQIHGPADPTPEQAAYWQLLRLQDAYSCSCRMDPESAPEKTERVLRLLAEHRGVTGYEDAAGRILRQRAFWDDSADPGLQADLERLAGVTA